MKHIKTFEKYNKQLVDELINKGWDNLTNKEKEYLKTPDNVNMTSKLIKDDLLLANDITFTDEITDEITAKLQIYDRHDNGIEQEYVSTLSINDDKYDCIIHCKNGEVIETEYVTSTPYDDYEEFAYEIDDFIWDAYYEIIIRDHE